MLYQFLIQTDCVFHFQSHSAHWSRYANDHKNNWEIRFFEFKNLRYLKYWLSKSLAQSSLRHKKIKIKVFDKCPKFPNTIRLDRTGGTDELEQNNNGTRSRTGTLLNDYNFGLSLPLLLLDTKISKIIFKKIEENLSNLKSQKKK